MKKINKSHYPSIETCTELSDFNFPETEKMYFNGEIVDFVDDKSLSTREQALKLPCPSLSELIDVISDIDMTRFVFGGFFEMDVKWCRIASLDMEWAEEVLVSFYKADSLVENVALSIPWIFLKLNSKDL